MATQKWNWIGTAVIVLAWTANSTFAQTLERFSFAEPHLGTIIELTIYAPDEAVANEAARTAFARVVELDRIFSDYKSDSEVMQLCEKAGSGRAIKVSLELYSVLKRAIAISEQTEGAFDVSVGPLVKLWRRARKERKLPAEDEVVTAKNLVGWKLISLNDAEQTVELRRTGMQLDFGGIAKGYIAQDVSRVLKERSLDRTLVAVAGDIVAGNSPPNADGWKIVVAPLDRKKGNPPRLLLLKNQAVSTSGDAFQFVEIDGVRYSHIVDPRTGVGLTRRSSVTVVALDGATADAWATAVSVLGTTRGLELVSQIDQLDSLVVQANDDVIEVHESKDFHRHELK